MDTKKIFVICILLVVMSELIPFSVLALEKKPAPTVSAKEWNEVITPPLATAFRYIFGKIAAPENVSDPWAQAVITIAIWLLIFITFADIIRTFSTFSQPVSWGIGFLIAVIVANFGGVVYGISKLTIVFASIGITSVYVGLIGAFIAFVIVNLGITSAGGWIKRRQAMVRGAKIEAGGIKVRSAVKALGKIGEGLEEVGKK